MFRTWVVVAQFDRARIFAMKDVRVPLLELADIDNPAVEGMCGEYAGEDRFARQIAARVDDAGADHIFDNLILVGDPEFLGEVRENLSDQTRARAGRIIAKRLVEANETELRKSLRTLM